MLGVDIGVFFNKQKKSKTIKGSYSPEWREEFDFIVKDALESDAFLVHFVCITRSSTNTASTVSKNRTTSTSTVTSTTSLAFLVRFVCK